MPEMAILVSTARRHVNSCFSTARANIIRLDRRRGDFIHQLLALKYIVIIHFADIIYGALPDFDGPSHRHDAARCELVGEVRRVKRRSLRRQETDQASLTAIGRDNTQPVMAYVVDLGRQSAEFTHAIFAKLLSTRRKCHQPLVPIKPTTIFIR